VVLELGRAGEESSAGLARAQQSIEQLNRTLKEARINQKSLANLKNLQNQLEYLQERNRKLTH
jgi:cell division protein FtsB